jgi:predicted phosphoribosyltransferase
VVFESRRDAGRQLAARLLPLKEDRPLVFGLPRGGVVVADEVARALGAPLDVVVARKIGAPFNAELAIGAVAEGVVHLDQSLAEHLGIPADYIARAVEHEQSEVRRREAIFRSGRERLPLEGRTVILVDDGLATGSTAAAAIESLRRQTPARLILAVPVGAPETVAHMKPMVDDLVCLSTPLYFRAVGQAYEDFGQTTDAEVTAILMRSSTT